MSTTFHYTARTGDGARVSGAVRTESSDLAIAHLKARALFVTSLVRDDDVRAAALSFFALLTRDENARVGFFRALAVLTNAGVPLRRALEVGIEQCRDARFREALRSVASEVERGSALAESFAQRPAEFAKLVVAMIRAGESGGVLHTVLSDVADLLERTHTVRKRVRSALAYPVVVSMAALLLILLLVADVVPAFAGMFAQMHIPLPLMTRWLIALGEALRAPAFWSGSVAAALVCALLISRTRHIPWLGRLVDGGLLALPFAGVILRKAAMARLMRTLGALLRSGVALAAAFDATVGVSGSPRYEAALVEVARSVRLGEGLASAFGRSRRFDVLTLQLLRVGEETGTLDAMFLRIAEHHEADADMAIAAFGSAIEPALIALLGAVVGTIVGSVLIPLYSIIGSIK